jgi:MATE family multidrug resistance protein
LFVIKSSFVNIKNRWHAESGYRQVLIVAIPLILSTGSWSVQQFVDRIFLTWYSPEAVAAAMPAGLLNFTLMSLFIGIAGYVSTFAAQYYGAGQYERIGPAIWQGIYVSLIGGLVLIATVPFAAPFFRFVGHAPEVQKYEVLYFQILCLGGFTNIASAAMSGFFSGRGKTWPVMWANVLGTLANVIGDYLLIFGNFGFPEWGIAGAAVATLLAPLTSLIVYTIIFTRPRYNHRYHLLKGWRFEKQLFMRLMKFGVPSGVQFFLDVAGFTAFLLFVGKIDPTDVSILAATNLAFGVNTLAFMPMIGIGIAVSVLVGQHLGQNRPDLAEKSTYSGFHLTFAYMSFIAVLYVLIPNVFLDPFAKNANTEEFARIRPLAITLLKFVAVYSIFDTMNIIFASAIKGAGDTKYVMYMIVIMSLGALVIPSYVAIVVYNGNIYVAWTIVSLYVILLGFAFLKRFLGGKWKSMRVIEEHPIIVPANAPANPTTSEMRE